VTAERSLLRERYALQARIGQGAMGVVYRALDLQTDRTVAVKQLLGGAPPASFEREASLLAQLSHARLPTVTDFFVEGEAPFLVMTFVPGPDLAQQLARRARPFVLRTVLEWADDILDALSYLHTRLPPVIHRDIKPRNLKLDADGRVVLLDFGLAKEAGGADSVLAGYTLPYAPLEQVRRQGIEARSDVYALGATLYELLARRAPADALERAGALAEGRPDPLTPLHELNARVPHSTSRVIHQALAIHPSQRPATARVMHSALHEAVDGPATVLVDVSAAPPELLLPPVGTVTFLATEVTGDAQDEAELARHDALLRQAVDRRAGYVFQAAPTGLGVAFANATDALSVALDVQRGLPSLRVRIALQTGAAELVDNEYVSHALPRLSRLLAAAHGGQIVLGRATAALCDASVALRDLGSHRVPDLAQPEQVFQVVVADLQADFPPLRSHEMRGSGIPVAAAPPIGRDREVAAVVEALRRPSVRMLTLSGPGGVGKTRLAYYAAEALLDDFSDGVYVVQLAAVRSPELVAAAIAQTLGIPEQHGQALVATLAAELRERSVLLVLDNFEHVLGAASVVQQLVASAPRLKALVTSRTLLGLDGEREQAVAPLPVAAASELFVVRARDVRPDLVLDEATAPAIAAICARLDGLPLAIELAAARSDLFDPPALLERLGRRLPLLIATAPRRPARQQTLRAALAWSYELVDDGDRHLFGELGSFVGGWDLEAAEAVCSPAADSGLSVPRGLSRLVAANLVRVDGARFDMLETVREYAHERLAQQPGRASTQGRHAEYFAALAETGDAELAGPRMAAWLTRLSLEHPNLRAALTWLAANGPLDTGLRLSSALWRFWQVRGHVVEGRSWLERLLALSQGEPSTVARARALVGAGALAWRAQDEANARRWLDEAVAVCRAVGELAGLATALKYQGVIALKGPPPDYDLATRLFEQSLVLRRELGDRDGTASCLNDLAVLARDRGDYARSRELLDESLALCRALDNRYGLSFVLNNLSLCALAEGAYERVPPLLLESLTLARELDSREKISCVLTTLASLASVTADAATAGRLYGAADALRETIGVPMSPAEQKVHDQHLERARAEIEPEAWQAAIAVGRAEELDGLIERTFVILSAAKDPPVNR